jgi:hypothetical protein
MRRGVMRILNNGKVRKKGREHKKCEDEVKEKI